MKVLKLVSSLIIALSIISCSDNDSNAGTSSNTNSNPAGNIQNAKPGLGQIAVLGDSIAFGTGSQDQLNVPTACFAKAYAQVVSRHAVPGLTTNEILEKSNEALSLNPKMIFVSSGGNDAIENYYASGSYPETQSISESAELFDRLLASGALVVYLGLNPPIPGGERLVKISDLARQKGVLVVDAMAGFWNNPKYMADQFHPNDEGYRLMCERLVEAINPYFQ